MKIDDGRISGRGRAIRLRTFLGARPDGFTGARCPGETASAGRRERRGGPGRR